MIDVVVSCSMCPHCEIQRTIMEKSFFPDEYRIIEFGSKTFESFDLKDKVDAVPFVVVRNDDGKVMFASKGTFDGTALRKLERTGSLNQEGDERVFNLRETRFAQSHMLSSMDN
jgi:hypothetical protein